MSDEPMALPVRALVGDDPVPSCCFVVFHDNLAYPISPYPLTRTSLNQMEDARREGHGLTWNVTLFFPPAATHQAIEGYFRANLAQ